ncbi:MAG: hypothetical protein HYV17_11790 [Xanthomonadales bacterium]|nr:hypothetical protein [Xanthomonadales bacterium]
MDATAVALELLDALERDDLPRLRSGLQRVREARVALRRDGLELVESAVRLDRAEALRELLCLGAGGQIYELFGIHSRALLTGLAEACLARGQMRCLVELLMLGEVLPSLGHDVALVDRVAAAVVAEMQLEDERVVSVVAACGTNRGAFLVQALRCGRLPLLRRLAATCTSAQEYGASVLGEVPLVAAAEAGFTAALGALVAAGAKPNVAWRRHGYPLHFALRCARLQPAERAELVHELLRLGAVPELRDADGLDAFALAAQRHDNDAGRVLREHGRDYGPRQSREARARGVRDVCLIYDKADGLIYRIGQPDTPFLSGGDYDGPCPCSVEQFRADYEQVRKRRPEYPLDWFEPFLARLERGQEFAYDEFHHQSPHIRFVRFDTSSNWSQMVD